jgi:hypothetical protein
MFSLLLFVPMSLYAFTKFVECNFHPTTCKSISNDALYVILHSKICWRKVELCQFGSGKSFWLSIIAKFAVAVEEGTTTLCTCTKECTKYHPTAAQCFWLAYHNDWSRWFSFSRFPHLFAVHVSVLRVGLQKSK